MSHTPGPWETGGIRTRVNAPTPKGWMVDLCVADCHVEPYCVENESERVANARLIAAAPELLEACEFAAKYLGPEDPSDGDKCWEAHAKLKAAIKKAGGEL